MNENGEFLISKCTDSHPQNTHTPLSVECAKNKNKMQYFSYNVKCEPLRMKSIQRMAGVRHQKCLHALDSQYKTTKRECFHTEFFVIRARVTFSYRLLSRNMRVPFICVEAKT